MLRIQCFGTSSLCVILMLVLWTRAALQEDSFSGINVARGKSATQSPGTYTDANGKSFPASLAVDGITNHNHSVDGCSHTSVQGTETAVWRVDLVRPYFITGIRIYNRGSDSRERLKGFQVYGLLEEVEKVLYHDNEDYNNLIINITLNGLESFNSVEIHKPVVDGKAILTLCEVEVFAGCDPHINWTLEHGQYSRINQPPTSGTVVYPTCDIGYNLLGIGNVTCQQNHTWSFLNNCHGENKSGSSWNKCEKITCKHPGKPQNGIFMSKQKEHENDNAVYGETITLKCDDGYKLDNASLAGRTCIEMNRWTESQTECIRVTCPWPQHINNGRYVRRAKDRNVYYGTEIIAQCNKRFTMVGGNGSRTCGTDGEWSRGKFTCVPVCKIKTLFYGYYADTDGKRIKTNVQLMENQTAYAVCVLGYEFNESVSRMEVTCTGEHEIEPSDLTCTAKRCTLPQIANGTYDTTEGSVAFGYPVKVTCDPGYQIEGPRDRFCKSNKNLSDSDPICKRITVSSSSSRHASVSPATSSVTLAVAVVLVTSCGLGHVSQA